MSNENEANNPAQDSLRAPEARLKEAREDIVAGERRAVVLVSACFVIIGYFLSFDFADAVKMLSGAPDEKMTWKALGGAFYWAGLAYLMVASWLGIKCFNLKDSESEIAEEDFASRLKNTHDAHRAILEKLRYGQKLLLVGFACACFWQFMFLLVELVPK